MQCAPPGSRSTFLNAAALPVRADHVGGWAAQHDPQAATNRDIDLAMTGNVCRCCTYHRIRAAIHDAAQRLEG